MIKRLDRVKLTARAAAAFNNNKRPSMFDWTARRGVVERITANKANAVVLWDGRKSMDVVPIRSIELEPEVGSPQTEHRRQRIHLAFAVLVCHLMRFGDLDVAIRLIAGDSDGRQSWLPNRLPCRTSDLFAERPLSAVDRTCADFPGMSSFEPIET
jgi:hypothetical protein